MQGEAGETFEARGEVDGLAEEEGGVGDGGDEVQRGGGFVVGVGRWRGGVVRGEILYAPLFPPVDRVAF